MGDVQRSRCAGRGSARNGASTKVRPPHPDSSHNCPRPLRHNKVRLPPGFVGLGSEAAEIRLGP